MSGSGAYDFAAALAGATERVNEILAGAPPNVRYRLTILGERRVEGVRTGGRFAVQVHLLALDTEAERAP